MNINQFLQTFFEEHHCHVRYLNPDLLDISLTEEMDRAIMNRPFYWQYMQSIGQKGTPQQLTLQTSLGAGKEQTEWIGFGTPRMNSICQYLEKTSMFTQLYEAIDTTEPTLLQPWLIVNISIRYNGKQMREEILSIGLNLINGVMIQSAMERFESLQLNESIMPHCYTISPVIKLPSAFQRINTFLYDYLKRQDKNWAKESLERFKEELLLLSHFYRKEDQIDELCMEISQLYDRFIPQINLQVINGGIGYLSERFLQSMS